MRYLGRVFPPQRMNGRFFEGDYRISTTEAFQEKWNTKTFRVQSICHHSQATWAVALPQEEFSLFCSVLFTFLSIDTGYLYLYKKICIIEMKTWQCLFPCLHTLHRPFKGKNCAVALVHDFCTCFDWFSTSPTGWKANTAIHIMGRKQQIDYIQWDYYTH